MNILIGVNIAYLSFVPNAGNSILFSIIAITLYTALSVIILGVCYNAKINQDNEYMLFQRQERKYLEIRSKNTQVVIY